MFQFRKLYDDGQHAGQVCMGHTVYVHHVDMSENENLFESSSVWQVDKKKDWILGFF